MVREEREHRDLRRAPPGVFLPRRSRLCFRSPGAFARFQSRGVRDELGSIRGSADEPGPATGGDRRPAASVADGTARRGDGLEDRRDCRGRTAFVGRTGEAAGVGHEPDGASGRVRSGGSASPGKRLGSHAGEARRARSGVHHGQLPFVRCVPGQGLDRPH